MQLGFERSQTQLLVLPVGNHKWEIMVVTLLFAFCNVYRSYLDSAAHKRNTSVYNDKWRPSKGRVKILSDICFL
jgi:hypothetical protein